MSLSTQALRIASGVLRGLELRIASGVLRGLELRIAFGVLSGLGLQIAFGVLRRKPHVSFRPVLYRQRILDLLSPHCDIATRIAAVPSTARVRGVYFRSALEELTRRGLLHAFEGVIHDTARSTFMLYPLADYILWIAWAGSLMTSPASVHAGMRELSRGNALYFGQSLLGRGLLRLLARDPIKLLHQAIQSKRAVTNYGRWFIAEEGARHIVVRHEEEYVWIESALLGAALGALESCGIRPTVEVNLRNPYNGDLVFRW